MNNQDIKTFQQLIKENSEKYQKFSQSYTKFDKNIRISQLIDKNLTDFWINEKFKAFKAYLETYNHPFDAEPPLGYLIKGDLVAGYYALNPNMIVKINPVQTHWLNIGSSGSGKSFWGGLFIPDQIIKLYPNTNLRVMIFASKQNCDQRNLILNNKINTVYYLDKELLALNCLSPIKNVDSNLIIADTARVIAGELGLLTGGRFWLQACLNEYTESHKHGHGNLIDFTKWIEINKANLKSPDFRGYRDRLLVRLKSSILNEIGDIFDYHEGIADKVFCEENLVIEIPFSSSFLMALVSGIIFSRMFRFKQYNPEYIKLQNIIEIEDIQDALRY
jgi:hypothetical protein